MNGDATRNATENVNEDHREDLKLRSEINGIGTEPGITPPDSWSLRASGSGPSPLWYVVRTLRSLPLKAHGAGSVRKGQPAVSPTCALATSQPQPEVTTLEAGLGRALAVGSCLGARVVLWSLCRALAVGLCLGCWVVPRWKACAGAGAAWPI
eukprot:357433-Chlamydomonas_euryale.AAC.1